MKNIIYFKNKLVYFKTMLALLFLAYLSVKNFWLPKYLAIYITLLLFNNFIVLILIYLNVNIKY